jgi:hypothetical protein
VVGAIAAAYGQDVDVVAPEVGGDAIELVDGPRFAHDAVIAQGAREAAGRLRIANVAPAARVEDDAYARHRSSV